MRVLCNATGCLFWRGLEEPECISRHKGESLPWDTYSGYCTRDAVGVNFRRIETYNTIYKVAECSCYSDKHFVGHVDFSRFPQGGRITENLREV
jgi:hypothetical protein